MELWYSETHDGAGITFKVKNILCKESTKYQEIVIMDTYFHGKVMIIDGLVMLTERDEFVYHEMITHPAVNSHGNVKDVLVIGGGDGGTVRELVKYGDIERIDIVEIDGMVIELSKKYLPSLSSGYSDKRVNIYVKDGIEFVSDKKDEYDLIIIDSTDPIGPAVGLFREDFYVKIKNALKDGGVMVAQSESPFDNSDIIKSMYKDMKNVFSKVNMYLAFIPTYPSGMWSFAFASDSVDCMSLKKDISDIEKNCKYYNKDVHISSFALPNFVKEMI